MKARLARIALFVGLVVAIVLASGADGKTPRRWAAVAVALATAQAFTNSITTRAPADKGPGFLKR